MHRRRTKPWRDTIVAFLDESIYSIVFRLAPLGVVEVFEFLAFALGIKPTMLPGLPSNREAIKELAYIGSFDADSLLARSWRFTENGVHFLGREMPLHWLDPVQRRLAPATLRHDCYTRINWQSLAFSSDLTTGEHLIERCSHCGAPLRWEATVPFTDCNSCKRDQRKREPTFAPKDILQAERELLAFIRGDCSELPATLTSLPDLALFEAMEWLPYFADLAVGKSLRPSVHVASLGLRLLKAWPTSFDSTLLRFLGQHADPPQMASQPARQNLMREFLVAVGRVRHPELKAVLTARAVDVLRTPSSDFDIQKKLLANPLRFPASEKAQSSKRGRGDWPRISAMRSNHC